jgi:hypothetical protein
MQLDINDPIEKIEIPLNLGDIHH